MHLSAESGHADKKHETMCASQHTIWTSKYAAHHCVVTITAKVLMLKCQWCTAAAEVLLLELCCGQAADI